MELLSLSLFGFIQKYGFPESSTTRKIIKNLLEGLSYLHAKGIMHRDLKLENIMVRADSKSNVEPVIVDFGLSEYVNSENYLFSRCGTPGYIAPEVMQAKSDTIGLNYNSACDIFSMGVIFHILYQLWIFLGSWRNPFSNPRMLRKWSEKIWPVRSILRVKTIKIYPSQHVIY